MQHIDQDTITQAVIARHTTAGDTRVREVMTSLVQHLHAFAREVRLTEAEWAEGVRFLGECGRNGNAGHQELVLLSDALGLSTLVTALDRRRLKGSTESTMPAALHATDVPREAQVLLKPNKILSLSYFDPSVSSFALRIPSSTLRCPSRSTVKSWK